MAEPSDVKKLTTLSNTRHPALKKVGGKLSPQFPSSPTMPSTGIIELRKTGSATPGNTIATVVQPPPGATAVAVTKQAHSEIMAFKRKKPLVIPKKQTGTQREETGGDYIHLDKSPQRKKTAIPGENEKTGQILTKAYATKRPTSMAPSIQQESSSKSEYGQDTLKRNLERGRGNRLNHNRSSYIDGIRDYYRQPREERRTTDLVRALLAARRVRGFAGASPPIELCPRIFAVCFVWLIIFVSFVAYAGVYTDKLRPIGMMFSRTPVTSEGDWCYIQTGLYEKADDCCVAR